MRLIFRVILIWAAVLAGEAYGQVAGPAIPLTGSIGVQGSSAILGGGVLQLTADANHTLSAPEYATNFLKITSSVSLTATRSLVAPLTVGQQFTIENATTGGQSIQVIGATGAGVIVANGTTVMVASDGTNYSTPASGSGTPIASSATINAANSQVQADSITTSTENGLQCFGTSYMAGLGATVTANGQCALIGSDLNTTTTNNAVAGGNGQDLAFNIFTALNPSDKGNPIVIADEGGNNVPGSTAGILNYKQVAYATNSWAAMSSTQKILMGNAAVTITGTTTTDTTFANANGKTCTTGTCTFSYSAQVGPIGVFYLYFKQLALGGTISVTVDAAAATDTISTATSFSSAWSVAPSFATSTVGAARFVTTNATHAVVVTVVTGGNPVTIYALGFPPTSRYRGTSAPKMFVGGTALKPGAVVSDTNLYNATTLAISQQLVADGLNTPFVDLRNVYDQNFSFIATAAQNCPATTQTAHPNDCGHRLAADLWESVINGNVSPVAGSVGRTRTVAGPLVVTSPDGAAVNPNVPSNFNQQPQVYTDNPNPMTDYCSTGGGVCGAGAWYTGSLYGPSVYGSSGKTFMVLLCASPLVNRASCSPTFQVDMSTGNVISNGSISGVTGSFSGAVGLAGINGGLTGTPWYMYATAQGFQPGAGNDNETFTVAGGSDSLGQVTTGVFTPWWTSSAASHNAHSIKIVNLPNGTAPTDAVAFGQFASPPPLGNTTANTVYGTTVVGYSSVQAQTLGQATAGGNFSSGPLEAVGSYWNGSSAQPDIWNIVDGPGPGTNPSSTLIINHSGSTGGATVSVPSLIATLLVQAPTVSATGSISAPLIVPTLLYSAAGTPLPSCIAGSKGNMSVVSDATSPTYLGAYVSGGAVVSAVICNGTSWVTH